MGGIFGTIQVGGHPIEVDANLPDDIGLDEDGRPIDILFGALAMQKWGIRLVPEEQRIDLSRYPEEFIEFAEVRVVVSCGAAIPPGHGVTRPDCGGRRKAKKEKCRPDPLLFGLDSEHRRCGME